MPGVTESEWSPIADRLEAAWPPFPPERRALYFDVLGDLAAASVSAAVHELVREDREALPAPGSIRQRVLATAPAPTARPETTLDAIRGADSGARERPEPAPSPTRGQPTDPLAALMAGRVVSQDELEASAPGAAEPAPGLAVASLVCGLVGLIVVPFVCAILAIVFGVVASNDIKRNPGKGGQNMAGWGIALGIFSLIVWTAFIVIAVASEDTSDFSIGTSLVRTLGG